MALYKTGDGRTVVRFGFGDVRMTTSLGVDGNENQLGLLEFIAVEPGEVGRTVPDDQTEGRPKLPVLLAFGKVESIDVTIEWLRYLRYQMTQHKIGGEVVDVGVAASSG